MQALVAATALFALLVGLFAAILLSVGRRARARIPGAAVTRGVVVGVESRPPPGRRHSSDVPLSLQHAHVQFTARDGRQRTFTSDFGTSLAAEVGRPVEVLYDPADPSRAQISPKSLTRSVACGLAAMWTMLGVVTVLGVVGLAIAWVVVTRAG